MCKANKHYKFHPKLKLIEINATLLLTVHFITSEPLKKLDSSVQPLLAREKNHFKFSYLFSPRTRACTSLKYSKSARLMRAAILLQQ